MEKTWNDLAFVHESDLFDGGEERIWSISINVLGDLCDIRNGALTTQGYRDEVLRLIMVLYTVRH